ncbi:MAG: rhomboid family intramembrane serine protease [Chthoniobacterales bacterium]|nr:rhomboid family intramembrane serine protease [Chthoniobacterales bacterium]
MLDLNHILLFVAWISPAVLLTRTWRGGVDRSWRRAAILVLLVTAMAVLFARSNAGFIAGGAWFCLLFLPAVAIRKAIESAQRGEFRRARRILHVLRCVHPRQSLVRHENLVAAFESAHAHGRRFEPALPTLFGQPRVRMTPAVALMLAINVVMFAAEIFRGGATNPLTLHRLGAMDPDAVLTGHQYWRLVSAMFLHYGALHLFVNLFALSFFGPTLEKMIGSARFVTSYLLCGVAACLQVALMWRFGSFPSGQLVGASGAVMGIVGVWAGVLLRERHLAQNRSALRSILLIFVIQSAFDIFTPQVSMAAHLGGFAVGFVVGLLLAVRKAPAPEPVRSQPGEFDPT